MSPHVAQVEGRCWAVNGEEATRGEGGKKGGVAPLRTSVKPRQSEETDGRTDALSNFPFSLQHPPGKSTTSSSVAPLTHKEDRSSPSNTEPSGGRERVTSSSSFERVQQV